ncbi:hypothetical protein DXC92_04005 [Clostridiales bacterium TF09-2AC]|uniref:hypothetical protein n=1 Tax=Enterocloster hominis (ex Hitch et al. 2024) TaxID=1917870 RepID=UPI000E70E654|nr:hypothetical protein [Lachnoclostridium pacaense]RJW51464.1 hypothetical protein DXC92_04005 [Clostridiales bacterium TF09-2AC]
MGDKAGEGMMGTWMIPALAVSLGLTVVLEGTFGWMLGVRNRWDMALVGLVNVLTNPAVVFLYYVNIIYAGWNRILVTVLLEMAAVAAEGLCYRAAGRGIRHPWLFSAGANLFSFMMGTILAMLI